MKIGVIASTGLEIDLVCDEYEEVHIIFGDENIKIMKGYIQDKCIYFVSRSLGKGPVPPHKVDYLSIMKLMKKLKVDAIISTSMVGSLEKNYSLGQYVIIDQFLDFTKNRISTSFNEKQFAFVDFTYPYCDRLRKVLIDACSKSPSKFHKTGCYVGVNGPRYETAAEVRAFSLLGGNIIGMTNTTEAILAREMGLCYASLALIVNYAAGLDEGTMSRKACYEKTMEYRNQTADIVKQAISLIINEEVCDCSSKAEDIIINASAHD